MAFPPPTEIPISATPVPSPLENPAEIKSEKPRTVYPAWANVFKQIGQVSRFKDLYGMVMPYCGLYEFEVNPNYDYRLDSDVESDQEEDPEPVADPIPTLVRYVGQIRKSFGFDVDCVAPSWFEGPFVPIDMARAKLGDKKYYDYDEQFEATKSAIAQINSEIGKKYELVELEKVVHARPLKRCLTFTVKEVGGGDESMKTIQALVTEQMSDCWDLLQWRYKPVEEDAWFEPPPLHVRCPGYKPPLLDVQ